MRRLTAALVLAAALACSQPAVEQAAAPAAIDTAAVVSAVSEVWGRLAEADTAGNAEAFLAQVATDSRFDFPGEPTLIGKAAIDATIRHSIAARDYTSMVLTPASTTVASDQLVYQVGTYAEGYLENGKATTQHGRYSSMLVKEADGQWRIARLMVLSDSVIDKK